MEKLISFCVLLFTFQILSGDIGVNRNFYDDYQIKTIDANALSLGRTSTLNCSPVFSLFDNPAMLSRVKALEIGVSSDWSKQKQDKPYEVKFKSNFALDAVSVVKPFKDNQIIIGAGYRELYAYNFKENLPSSYYSQQKYYYSGNFGVYTMGLAISDKSGIAIGLNINHGANNNESEGNINYYTNTSSENYGKMKEKISSTFINLGFKVENDFICIGGTLTPAHSINYESTLYFDSYTGFPGHWSYEFAIDYPLTYSIGLNLKPEKNTLIAIEYRIKNLKEITLSWKDSDNDFPLYHYGDDKAKNGNDFRVGLEYKFILPIRVGYYWTAIPLFSSDIQQYYYSDNYYLRPLLKPNYQKGYTFGTEINPTKHFSVKVAYDRSSFSNYYSYYSDDTDTINKITYSHYLESIMVNISYKIVLNR